MQSSRRSRHDGIVALPRAARPLLEFIALLRRNGFSVAPEQGLAFLRAIELLGPRDIEDIRRAGVATLAPPFERQPDFDMLFDMHFLGLAGVLSDQVAESDEELEVQDDGAGYDAPLSDDINETGQAAAATRGAFAARTAAGQTTAGNWRDSAGTCRPGCRAAAAIGCARQNAAAASTCSARCETPSAPTAS